MKPIHHILPILFAILPAFVTAQTGPGGVGENDGTSSLELWLKADQGVLNTSAGVASDGEDVEDWQDQSGNGNNFNQDFGINPIYSESSGIFSVDFSGGSAYLRASSFFSGTGARTMIMVAKPSSLTAATSNCIFQLGPNQSAGRGYAFFTEAVGGSSGLALRVSGNKIMNHNASTSNPSIFSVQNGASENVTAAEFYVNGSAITTLVSQSANALNTSALGAIIGGFSTGTDNDPESQYDFNGNIYEILVYSEELDEVSRILIENHLGAKYGITPTSDYFAYESTHPRDVVGIGQASATTHTEAQSGNMLRMYSASSIDTDGDFLLAGHDNGDISSWSTSESPDATNVQRLAREWRFTHSGNVGTISLSLDTAELPAKPADHEYYQIWVDNDGDFSSGATAHSLTLNGNNEYEATGVDIANGDFVIITVFRPELAFTNAASAGAESTGAPNIEINMNYAAPQDIEVDFTDAGSGSATEGGGNDFTVPASSVTITAGNTTALAAISINDDGDVESDETVVVNISSPSKGIIGSQSSHTYTINDDDNPRIIDFQTNTGNGSEGTSPVNITIEINTVDATNPTTVDYTVATGTATGGGIDYTLASGTATIAATTTTTNLTLLITDDLVDESDETIVITLSNPANANLGPDIVYTYTLNDDDAEPTVQWLTSSAFGYEDAGSGSLILSLSATSGQDVTVDYTITGGTATSGGVDYTLASGTATITAGNITGSIPFTITNDASVESQETIEVTISNPSGASLGTTTVHTFAINDNDNDGFTGPAGVGGTDGNSSLELWLKADAGVEEGTSDAAEVGDNVENWLDQSGNGNDFNQDFGINPTYTQNGSTYAIDFSGGSAYLRSSSIISGSSARTMMTVMKPNSLTASASNCYFQLAPNEASGKGYVLCAEGVGANSGMALRVSGNKVMNYTHSTSNPEIISVQNGIGENVTDAEFFANGAAQTTLVSQSAATINTSSLGVTIGGFSTGADNDPESQYDFDGDVHEIIVFSKELNNVERILLENYLGAKYGISVTNDVYAFDGTHAYDLAGIGQEGTDTHIAAMSANMLGVSNPSSVDTDGDYLVFAHDNGDIASWITTDAPNSGDNTYRVAREWKFDETGDVGTVTLLVDTNDLPSQPSGYTQYVAWVDANGVFASGATQHELTLAGDYYQASGLDIADGAFVTIGMVKPTVGFATANSNGSETTSASITVALPFSLGEDVTVDYAVTGGTATSGGTDFTLASGTATIIAGQTSTTISPSIINDTELESDETIQITLTNPSSGVELSDIASHIYTINDDDNSRKIDFNTAASSGGEGTSPVTLIIEINSIDPTNPTTVDYAATGGTASGSGTDYTLASGTAIIAATTSSTTIDISLSDDLIDEDDETIIISLSSPTNSNLGPDATYTFTINDDDSEPTVGFLTTTSYGYEDAETSALVLSLSAVSGQDVTVDYVVSGGTATGSGTDYTLVAGTATITAGNSTGNIEIILVDDATIESQETVEVTISNPSGATLGTNTVHTFTINDNDNEGFSGPGGIGGTDGSTSLELWLKADAGVEEATSDAAEVGDDVENWLDQSGNGNDFNSDFGSNPVYDLNGSIYGIDFSGGSAYLRGSSILSGTGARTIIAVGQPTSLTASGSNCIFQLAPNEASGRGYGLMTEAISGSSGLALRVSGNKVMNYTTSTSTPSILSVQNGSGENVTDAEFYANGTAQTTLVSQNAATLNTSSIGTMIGGFSSSADNDPESQFDFNGNVHELIVFSKELNDVERVLIENSLGAKYGISVANDVYAYDTNNGQDVAGIGQEGSDTHSAALSGNMLGVTNPSSVDTDGDYLLFGHNAGDITTWTTTDAPNSGTNTYRITREWRFDHTGDVGTVTIIVDASELPTAPSGYTQYVVWTDADGLFNSGTTQIGLTLVGDYYQASGITVSDGSYMTIGMIKPTISFDESISSGSEASTATIPVSLNFALGADATVDYSVTGGTASGSDFTLASGTLTIVAGQTTANISPSIINDVAIESDETIEITISNPSSGIVLGTNTSHTYSINDDDNARKIDFLATSSSGDEGTTPVTITVQINSVDATNPTTADYAVTSGTADGSDYTLASGTLTVAATTTSNTFDLVIDEDGVNEDDETIIITLSNPTNANLGPNTTYTYTINDNDAEPTLSFAAATSSGSEGNNPAELNVALSATSGQDVTVDYAVTGGTATGGGTDYTLAAGTLTITAGNSSANIEIAIEDDGTVEVPETIEVTISNPSGATISGTSVHTYTINDNDNGGYQGPGGVGAIDGSSSLELWLKADAGVEEATSDPAEVSDNVENWLDQSGNGNNFNHDFGLNPVYAQNGDLYSIDFSGGSAYLRSSSIISGSSARTVIVAAKPSSLTAAASNTVFQLAPNSGAGEGFGLCYEGVGGSTGLAVRVSGNKIMNYSVSTSNPSIISVQNGSGENITDCDFYADGTTLSTLVSQSANTLNTNSLGVVIGGFSTDSDNDPEAGSYDFNGDVYEIIVFSEEIGNAQRILIENYLGAKYGITVGSERFAESQSVDYKYDVAGIGHEGGTDFQNQAQGGGILTISDASTLSSGDYLMFGHDNGSISAWTSTETPGANQERLAREWYFTETNDVGNITVTVDTSLFAARSANYESFQLYVDNDGDFTSGVTTYTLEAVGGSEFAAENVAIADGNYMAIGAIQFSSQSSGDWDDGGSWAGSSVPGSGEVASITGTHTITLTQNETVGSVEIATGATLDIGAHTLTIDDGCMTLSGSATVTMTTGTIKYTKNGDQCITGNTANFPSYSNLTVETGGEKTLADDIVVTNDLTIGSGVTFDVSNGNNYNITIGGDFDNSGTFEARSGTVTFNGSADQSITDNSGTANFHNINVSNTAGAVKPADDLAIGGDVTILASTGVLDLSANNTDAAVEGDWTNNNGASGFVQGTSTVTFAGSADQTITNSSGSEQFHKLNISNTGGVVKPASDLEIEDDLTIMASTSVLDVATSGVDITVGGNWVNNNGSSGFLPGTQSVTFNNNTTASIINSSAETFYDLYISNTGGSVRAAADLQIANDLEIVATTGVLDVATNGKDIEVGGNWTNNNGASGFVEGTELVTFNGSGIQIIGNSSGVETFYDMLVENGVGSVTPTVTLDFTHDFTVTGNFEHNSQLITFTGSLTQDAYFQDTLDLYSVTTSNPSGLVLQTGSMRIMELLTVSTGTFSTNDNLIIGSDASGTGAVAPLIGNISGDLALERYVSGASNEWRMFGSTISDFTFADFDDEVITTGIAGSDYPSFGFKSIYTYNETALGSSSSGYEVPDNITDPLVAGKGYQAYINLPAGSLTLSHKGTVNQGAFNFPVTYTDDPAEAADEDGWNMLANPYPATIDWDDANWTRTNVDDAIYAWNSASEVYSSYVAGIGTNGGSRYIASSQGFWVHATGTPTLAINENVKHTTDQAIFKTSDSPAYISIKANNGIGEDEMAFRITPEASLLFDANLDAVNFGGQAVNFPDLYGEDVQGEQYSIQSITPEQLAAGAQFFLPNTGTDSVKLQLSNLTSVKGLQCLTLLDVGSGNSQAIENNNWLTFPTDLNGNHFILTGTQQADVHIQTDEACFDGEADITIEIAGAHTDDGYWELINENEQTVATITSPQDMAATVDQSGNYSMIYNSSGNCTEGAELVETLTIRDELNAALQTSSPNCYNQASGEVNVSPSGGSAPYTYSWSNGQTNAIMVGIESGVYDLTLTDQFNCVWTTTTELTPTHPVVATIINSNPLDEYALNALIQLDNYSTGASQFEWIWNGKVSGAISPKISFDSPGQHTIQLVASNAYCSDTTSYNVVVSDWVTSSSVLDTDESSSLLFHRNNDYFLQSLSPEKLPIRISTIDGKVIANLMLEPTETLRLPLESHGVFVVHVIGLSSYRVVR